MNLIIDWKEVSSYPVYRELKQELVDALNEINHKKQTGKHTHQTKEKLYRNFKKIIDRAKHIALHEKIPFITALEKMKKANRGYLSPYNANCILNRLDKNNPLCWAQKLPHNQPPDKIGRKRHGPKARWHKWRKEHQKQNP